MLHVAWNFTKLLKVTRGHSKSLNKMCVSSYSYSIATMSLSCTVYERYSASNNGLPLKQSGLGVTQGHRKWHYLIDHIQVPIDSHVPQYTTAYNRLRYRKTVVCDVTNNEKSSQCRYLTKPAIVRWLRFSKETQSRSCFPSVARRCVDAHTEPSVL